MQMKKNVFSLLVLSAITIGTAALATSCNKNNNQTSNFIDVAKAKSSVESSFCLSRWISSYNTIDQYAV